MQMPWSTLNLQEMMAAAVAMAGWSPADQCAIEFLLSTLDEFTQRHLERQSESGWEKNETYVKYVGLADKAKVPVQLFLSVYLIAGNITKKGPTEDIDLLVATNLYFRDSGSDPIQVLIDSIKFPEETDEQGEALPAGQGLFKIEGRAQIPSNYNLTSGTFAKTMFRMEPVQSEETQRDFGLARPIDLTYIKCILPESRHTKPYIFLNEKQFIELDVDAKTGLPLARLPIYKTSHWLERNEADLPDITILQN